MNIIKDVKSMGADFDMELLLCTLKYYADKGVDRSKICWVGPTLFTEDFAESNFMASSEDPDKNYKAFASMNHALISMNERYMDQSSDEVKAMQPLVKFL